MNSFKVSYVTTLPKEANAPRVTISGDIEQSYKVYFYDLENKTLVSSGICKTNQTIFANARQWFTKWYIEVHDEMDLLVYKDSFQPNYKTIFIKIDSWALGDTIAWIPYVEEFRKKYKCHIICSTFHNDLFVDLYPEFLFVQPNTVIRNVYAQFYIGVSDLIMYSPISVSNNPLQSIATKILGLSYIELRPELERLLINVKPQIEGLYVTLSEFGSSEKKTWSYKNGWQLIVDYLNDKGIKVVVISKEKTSLTNVIDLSGDHPIYDRMKLLLYAKCHIGISSGLSWLSWAVGCHTILISDYTPKNHEFTSNVSRIGGDHLESINYLTEFQTTPDDVIKKVSEWLDA